MSEIKVNKVSPATGTAITLGDSGDTFTVPSGANIVNSGTATGFGGGKVLQVVSTSVGAATASASSSSWVDISGMSVAITPSATSSKVFVIAQLRVSGNMHHAIRLVRNDGSSDTGVGVGDIVGSRYGASAGGLYRITDANTQMESINMVLDTPSTTSARTYKVQWCNASGTIYLNRNDNNTDTGGGASTSARDSHSFSCITVFEIGA